MLGRRIWTFFRDNRKNFRIRKRRRITRDETAFKYWERRRSSYECIWKTAKPCQRSRLVRQTDFEFNWQQYYAYVPNRVWWFKWGRSIRKEGETSCWQFRPPPTNLFKLKLLTSFLKGIQGLELVVAFLKRHLKLTKSFINGPQKCKSSSV